VGYDILYPDGEGARDLGWHGVLCFTRTIDLENYADIFWILAYSDIHWGSIQCDEDNVIRDLGRYTKDKDVYYLSLGDELNCIPLQDTRSQLSDLHPRIAQLGRDGSFRDDFISAQIEDYCDRVLSIIPPERDLGHTSGNHPAKVAIRSSTYDASSEFCRRAGRLHLGYDWRYRLDVAVKGKLRARLNLYGHHGFGGGTTVTADKIRYLRNATAQRDADIALFGHTHRRWYEMLEYFDTTTQGELRLIPGRKHIACCGAYLKTLSNRPEASYAERGGYTPVPMGSWLIGNKIVQKGKAERIYSWFLPVENPAELPKT
jgi:hypothetical protein